MGEEIARRANRQYREEERELARAASRYNVSVGWLPQVVQYKSCYWRIGAPLPRDYEILERICDQARSVVVALHTAVGIHDGAFPSPLLCPPFVATGHRGPVKLDRSPFRVVLLRMSRPCCGEKYWTTLGKVRVFTREKTICDLIKYRRRYQIEDIMVLLHRWWTSGSIDLDKLHDAARATRTTAIVGRYIELLRAIPLRGGQRPLEKGAQY